MLARTLQWIKSHRTEFIILILILVVGGFFRLYQVGEWMHFGQDEGRDAFMVKSIVADGDVQLLGPAAPNNRPDFHLGPFFYYFLVPFYWLSGLSPAGGAWAVALVSLLTVYLVYVIGKIFFGWRAGLMAAALFSVSFLMVYYGRWAWNPNVVPLFALLVFLSLYKLTKIKDNKRNEYYLYVLAASFSLIIQLHGTALIALPVILLFYFVIFRPKIAWQKYMLAVLIVIVLNSPSIVYDLTNIFDNTKGFWTVITQTESGQVVGWFSRASITYEAWQNFWHENLLHSKTNWIFFVLLAGSIIFVLIKLWPVKKAKENPGIVLSFLWLAVPFIIFTFYKEAIPVHYFCFIFPLPFLLLAGMLDNFWRRKEQKIVIILVVLAIFGLQIYYSVGLLNDLQDDGSRASSYPVTLADMQSAVDYIIEDSGDEKFSFSSQPAGQYDKSYLYLFDLQEVIPSVVPERIEYKVLVGKDEAGEVFGNVTVFKKTLITE